MPRLTPTCAFLLRLASDSWGSPGEDLAVISTGEKLIDESFAKLREKEPNSYILTYSMTEDDMIAALKRPGVVVGSDGMPFFNPDNTVPARDAAYGTGRGHPRGSGSHAKLLRMVREE